MFLALLSWVLLSGLPGSGSAVPAEEVSPCLLDDSLNVSRTGGWPFGASYDVEADPERDLVFLGSGGGVYILEFDGSGNPEVLSDDIRTSGSVADLFYQQSSQLLFIASRSGGVEVWDVSDPFLPEKDTVIRIAEDPYSLSVQDDLLYLIDYGSSLLIIDIAEPSLPVLLGQCDSVSVGRELTIYGQYAYIADGYHGIKVIDVSDPFDPFLAGSSDATLEASQIEVNGSWAYVADASEGVRAFDVSDPTDPVPSGGFILPGAASIRIAGGTAFVGSSAGFSSVSLDDPASPELIQTLSLPGQGHSIFSEGDKTYVAMVKGCCMVDVSNPELLTLEGFYEGPGNSRFIVADGSYAYVATGLTGIITLDITNPDDPFEVGRFQGPGWMYDMDLCGDFLYVADYENGMLVLDVSDPCSIQTAGSCNPTLFVHTVAVSGQRALAGSGLMYTGVANLIDVTDPFDPQPIDYCNIGKNPSGAFIWGNYGLVATGGDGLYIVSMVGYSAPSVLGHCIVPGGAQDVEMELGYAFVASSTYGLHVVRVVNPANPYVYAGCELAGSPFFLRFRDSYAYVATSSGGFSVVDVSDPAEPAVAGYHGTPTASKCLEIAEDGTIMVATQTTGIQCYGFDSSSIEEPHGEESIRPSANPLTEAPSFDVTLPAGTLVEVRVYDVAGRLRQACERELLSEESTLTLADLPAGVYIAVFQWNRESSAVRFTVIDRNRSP